MAIVKRALLWLLLAFLVYYLVKDPQSSAAAVRGAGEAIGTLFRAVEQFFRSLSG